MNVRFFYTNPFILNFAHQCIFVRLDIAYLHDTYCSGIVNTTNLLLQLQCNAIPLIDRARILNDPWLCECNIVVHIFQSVAELIYIYVRVLISVWDAYD